MLLREHGYKLLFSKIIATLLGSFNDRSFYHSNASIYCRPLAMVRRRMDERTYSETE